MKFEYCAIYYDIASDWAEVRVAPQGFNARSFPNALNRFGEDGWELVSSSPISPTGSGPRLYIIFKRPIEE